MNVDVRNECSSIDKRNVRESRKPARPPLERRTRECSDEFDQFFTSHQAEPCSFAIPGEALRSSAPRARCSTHICQFATGIWSDRWSVSAFGIWHLAFGIDSVRTEARTTSDTSVRHPAPDEDADNRRSLS